jgi:hypothetical protein
MDTRPDKQIGRCFGLLVFNDTGSVFAVLAVESLNPKIAWLDHMRIC